MIYYYLETYKEYRKNVSTERDHKRIIFAVLMILIPSIIMLGNIIAIAIYGLYKKQEINSNWKNITYIIFIVFVILFMVASFIDNRWKGDSYVLKYNERIKNIIKLKQKIYKEYKFNNKYQYEMILEKIKSEKDHIISSSNTWFNKSKKAFFSFYIVIFVALTPATITGLMNNYGKKEAETINRKEFLDNFAYVIFMVMLLLLFLVVLGIVMGYFYSYSGKKHIRILEEFEEDMKMIIEIDTGLHPVAIQIIFEIEKKEKEDDEKYLNNANKAREITDRNSFSS